jgi:hypothetical protein
VKSSVAGRIASIALPVLALLLLAAHFYRGGAYPLAVIAIALTGLTFVANRWAGQALALLLLCGAVEWLRTAWIFATLRDSMGLPFGRLLVILGTVAVFTLISAYVAWSNTQAGAAGKTD